MQKHETFMREAIELSRNGFPAPNPHVGCVIVKDDIIVGSGFCNQYGGDHAEVMALKEAGSKARGATAYATLEPCNHFGKTPPCTHALVNAGVSNVVVATLDENPIAAVGIDYLSDHGIFVESGILAQEAAQANSQFLFAMRNQRPMVTVKAGITLDGKVALPTGESQWITTEASRHDVMILRVEAGCVLVGRKTAEKDRARLTVRGLGDVNQPLRVVIDQQSKLDPSLPIFDDSAPTLHLNHEIPISSPDQILQLIWEHNQTGVLVEGGPTTTSHFFNADLVDRIVLYIAPKVFGDGPSWIGTFGLSSLADAPQFKLVDTKMFDGDVKLTYHSRNLQNFLASYNM